MTRNLRIAKSKLGAALLIGGLLLANSAAYGAAPATAAGILHAPRAMVNGAQVERSAGAVVAHAARTGPA